MRNRNRHHVDIHTIGNGKDFLEPERLNRLPSVMAVHESPLASDKYNFFSTQNILSMLKTENWLPVLAQEQNVKTEGRVGFQKHLIRLRQPGQVFTTVGDIVPELIITNSHDTRSAYNFMFGLFRLACLNGMIVSEAEFGTIRIPHVGFREEDVIDASYKIIEDVPRIVDKVQQYKALPLTSEERYAYAESALVMKFADDDETVPTKVDGANLLLGDRVFNMNKLLAPRRTTDEDRSLWTTFNIIQEKFIKGNEYEDTVRHNEAGSVIRKRKVAGIKGINENIRINRGLWQLTDLMKDLKAQATA